MFRRLIKGLTKGYNEVPLLFVHLNLNKYKKNGAKNSCMVRLHPTLKNDDYLKDTLEDVVEYIRDNYDMEELVF